MGLAGLSQLGSEYHKEASKLKPSLPLLCWGTGMSEKTRQSGFLLLLGYLLIANQSAKGGISQGDNEGGQKYS